MRAKDASGHNLGAVHVVKECHLAVADIWYYNPDGSSAPVEARQKVYVFDLKVSPTRSKVSLGYTKLARKGLLDTVSTLTTSLILGHPWTSYLHHSLILSLGPCRTPYLGVQ